MISLVHLQSCPTNYTKRHLPFLLNDVSNRHVPLQHNPTINFQCRFKWESMERLCHSPDETVELKPLVSTSTTKNAYVSIHQITGVSASRSKLSLHSSFDEMAVCRPELLRLPAETLVKSIDYQIHWLKKPNSFVFYDDSKELYWDNGNGSHRFAALKSLLGKCGHELLLPASIRSYRLNAGAFKSQNGCGQTFLISITDHEMYAIIDLAHSLNDTVCTGRHILAPGSTSNSKVFECQRNPVLLTFSNTHFFGRGLSRALRNLGYEPVSLKKLVKNRVC